MKLNTTIKTLTAVTALAVAGSAFAGPVYEYERGAGAFNNGSSSYGYDSISASYDTNTQDFTFTVDYAASNAPNYNRGNRRDTPAAGWLVVNAGGNPKGGDNLAIIYFDGSTRNGDVWAYDYNGANSSNSWRTENQLDFFDNAYTRRGDTATLSINAGLINSLTGGEGLTFGPQVGIWFHPAFGGNVRGNANGLHAFNPTNTVWYDTAYEDTTTVPAPATLALLGMALMGLGARRRKLV